MNPRNSLLIILALILIFSCSQPSDSELAGLLDTEFYSFQLLVEDNAGLAVDITGRQDNNSIILEYPVTTISNYKWIPRFSTDAVSVEIDGVLQSSQNTLVDFTNPVTYTLTAESGLVQQFDVELRRQMGWQELGDQALFTGLNPSSIKTGFLNDLNPFVLCLDNTSTIRAYAYDIVLGTSWDEFLGGPTTIDLFDSIQWNGLIWIVYHNTAFGEIRVKSTLTFALWSGHSLLTSTSSTSGLHLFSGSKDRLFAAWIDDSSVTKQSMVWDYDGATWQQVGSSPISEFHAESFRAVSDGGSNLYAAYTFGEAPGRIHLYECDVNNRVWERINFETSTPSSESERIIIDMFYDTELKTPVIVMRSKNYDYDSTYTIKTLYYNELAAVWTDLDYVEPLYITEADYSSLSIDWYENKPSFVFGDTVVSWEEDRWMSIGGSHSETVPSVQSLSRGILNTYFTAYRDTVTGDLNTRFYQ